MNTSDIFKIAEIKNAEAAETQKLANTIKSLNEICEKSGYRSLEAFLVKIKEFKNDNGGVSSSKKVKRAEKIAKAPKKTRNRSVITQAIVDEMAKDCAAELLTAAQIAEKHGVSVASYNVYKKKKFAWNPKPKGRRKDADKAGAVQPT
jgi:hypothetical protein